MGKYGTRAAAAAAAEAISRTLRSRKSGGSGSSVHKHGKGAKKTARKPKHHSGRTMIKTKQDKLQGDDIHSGLSERYVRVFFAGAKKVHKGFKRDVLRQVIVTGGRNTEIVGVQAVNTLAYTGLSADWLTTSLGGYDGSYGGWFAMNPNQLMTGSKDAAGNVIIPVSTSALTDKMMHVRSVFKFSFTNLSNIAQYHTIYVFECVRNTTAEVISTWTDGLSRQAAGSINMVIPVPGSPAAPGALTTPTVGCKPQDCSELGKFWKLRKTVRVLLAAGASDELVIDVEVRKAQTREYMQRLNDQGITYPTGTIQIIDVCHAQVVDDLETGGGVTYGPVNYGFACSRKTSLMVGDVKRREKVTWGYQALVKNTSNTNIKTMDINDIVSAFTAA